MNSTFYSNRMNWT